jgi:regulator of sigma E protease
MHEFLVSVLAFVVLLGVMVVVHEFGHFIVAKLCKVRVEAFSFGFGPRLFGYKHGDTDYKVCLLPLGGYVKMTGESEEQNLEGTGSASAEPVPAPKAPIEDPGSLLAHPRWQRMLIGVAGPAANFLLAFVLMVVYYGWFNEVPAVEVKDAAIEWVIPGSAADQAGFHTGDIIRRFSEVNNPSWDNIAERFNLVRGQTVPVTVERDGRTVQLTLAIPRELKSGDLAGILPQFLAGPIGVQDVQSGTPAEQAGLHGGDAIQSVDGHEFHFIETLIDYLQDGKGKPVSLVIVRNGAVLPPIVVKPAKQETGWKLGFLAAAPPVRTDPLPLGKSVSKSTHFCVEDSSILLQLLERIASRKVAAGDALSGPVGIARVAGDAAEAKGWDFKFNLAAQISLNLGIINLLPFPILDGGMIFFLLIESVIRRDINVNVKERIYQVAFVLIVLLFAYLIFNDISKLPFFEHLKH